jgi:hypothetical protein
MAFSLLIFKILSFLFSSVIVWAAEKISVSFPAFNHILKIITKFSLCSLLKIKQFISTSCESIFDSLLIGREKREASERAREDAGECLQEAAVELIHEQRRP